MFNLVAILTLFPAAMALDLRRQRAGRVDLLCCLRGDPVYPKTSLGLSAPRTNYYSGGTVQVDKKAVKAAPEDAAGACWNKLSLQHFVQTVFAPMLNKIYVKVRFIV